jgi:two-component system sensor histidine kinase DesK
MTHRTRRRLATVLLAPIAALGAWALLRLDGVDLAVTTGDGTVGPVDVVTSALIGAVKSDPHRAEAELREVQRATREALADVRQAVQGYRGPPFADALERARETLTAAGIDCRVDAVASGLPDEVDSVLAWAVREATTNVVRHSNARTCAITLSNDFNGVALEIEDDGAAPAPGNGDGSGLVGLAERARSLHGALDAGARPGGGFRLRLTLPGPAK